MTKRGVAPILLLAILLGGVSDNWNRPSHESRLDAGAGVSASASRVAQPERSDDRVATIAILATPAARPAPTINDAEQTTHVELSGDASMLLAEQVALQTLAGDADIPLTPDQWSAFARVTLHHQAIRQAYEATIATAAQTERGQRRLEIPAYPFAGDALRDRFHAGLRTELGGDAAEEIVARMGSRLEGHFAGFGVSVQTLEFAAEPGAPGTDYQVTRTVQYWNSVEGASRLTTRRETHVPGLEDPTGVSWGAFLSLLATRAERAGS